MSCGAIFIDKPVGITSFQVANRVRKKFQFDKIGHCGTLDPDATGLLILLVNEATRFQQFIMADEKAYSGRILLGRTTTTDDTTGEVLSESPVPHLSDEILRQLKVKFSGLIQQTPPQFSAIKKDGKRAYKIAREGGVADLESREVTCHSLELTVEEGNTLGYQVHCSKGFYIRSLARDIGAYLKCGGVTASIRRERLGEISIEEATPLDAILSGELPPIVPIDRMLSKLSRLELSADQFHELLLGRQDLLASYPLAQEYSLITLENRGISGLLGRDGDGKTRVKFLIPLEK